MTVRGTGEQVAIAKTIIEDKLKDAEEKEMRQKMSPARPGQHNEDTPIRSVPDPLFLTSEATSQESVDAQPNPLSVKGRQEELRPTSGDNLVEVYVASIADPGHFYVQKIGPSSVELDKLVEDMTAFYDVEANREMHQLAEVNQNCFPLPQIVIFFND